VKSEGARALTAVARRADGAARWLVVALGFSIPISVALDNILLALLLLCWLAGGRYREKLAAVRANPVALYACALFALYAMGALYSVGDWESIAEHLRKAARLLLIPIVVTLLDEPVFRRRALWGFLGAMLLTLWLSYLLWLDMLPAFGFLKGTPESPDVFKLYLTQNVFLAFAAFACAVHARHAGGRGRQAMLAALSLLAAANVLFLSAGRTGHVVLVVLLAYLLFSWLRWRGLAVAAGALAVVAILAHQFPSAAVHQRAVLAYEQFMEWRQGGAAPATSSVGLRLEFYRNSLEIVREHPLLGVGTGGFARAYAQQVQGTGMAASGNPHNEYLMVAVQLGLIGLAAFLGFLWVLWRSSAGLSDPFEQTMARGLIITFATASMVSSTLIDHAEGLLFAWACGLLFAGLGRGQRAGAPEPRRA
jgi:O-antigen ligase